MIHLDSTNGSRRLWQAQPAGIRFGKLRGATKFLFLCAKRKLGSVCNMFWHPAPLGLAPPRVLWPYSSSYKKWEAGQIWMAALAKPCVPMERWSGWVQIQSIMVSRLLSTVVQIIAVTLEWGWTTKWNATIGIGFQFYCQISESAGEH